ncbi:TPA: hypothetical protein ACNUZJ_001669 [Raoultella ornithinolytica]
MSDDTLPTKRISELQPASDLNDSAVLPLSSVEGGAFKTYGAPLSEIRKLFLSETALESTDQGLALTTNNQTFYIWHDTDRLFVDEYINAAGVALATGITLPSINAISYLVSTLKSWAGTIDNTFMHRDAVPGFLLPVQSKNGITVGFKKNGGVFASHLEIPGLDELSPRDGPLFIPIIRSPKTGRSGIYFDPRTGETGALLNAASVEYIKQRLGDISGGYVPPTVIRGGWQVANVRMTENYNYAMVQERLNSLIFDAKQKKLGNITTLVPDHPQPMRARGVMGQSNAVYSGNVAVIETRQLFPFSALTFDYGSVQQGGSGDLDENKLMEFIPLSDKASETSNQLPATLTAFANEYLKSAMGGIPQGEIVFTAGQGSVAMEQLLPGSVNWNNYFKFLRKAVSIASTYERNVTQRFVTLIQGENGNNWARDYASWADAIIVKIKEVAPDTEKTHVLLWQITGGGNGYENGVGTLQLSAADTRDDTILVGSMNGFPTVSDNTHLTPEGRMMLAECQAYAERIIEANDNNTGPAWQAFRMKTATRNSDTVEITLTLPPGVKTVKRDNFSPPVEQDGYIYANNIDGIIPVTQVTYPGSTVLLKLSRVPTAGATGERISYGLNTRSNVVGWPWYRGNTVATTNQRSFYNNLGYNVPEIIQFYLARERLSIGA